MHIFARLMHVPAWGCMLTMAAEHTPKPMVFGIDSLIFDCCLFKQRWPLLGALPTQLLWYEGKPFPLPRPQNSAQYNGHLLYQGTAPIFVTVKEKDLGPIIAQAQVALAQGVPSEHTMLMRRLKIYSFTKPLPRSSRHIVECPSCFAKLLLRYGL